MNYGSEICGASVSADFMMGMFLETVNGVLHDLSRSGCVRLILYTFMLPLSN